MALFQECSLKCARKVLDTADIVREAIFHQLLPLFTCLRSEIGCSLRGNCSCATTESLNVCHPFSQVPLRPHSSTSICFLLLSEGRIILAVKRNLNLDFAMLTAIERFITGANAHNLRGLANAYVLACENNQPGIAEEYRTRLLRELIRSARGSGA